MAQSGGNLGRTVAVLTCPGEIDDPNFPKQCSELLTRLKRLVKNDDLNVVKCEPWNSVKITFDLPAEAAEKLSELAKAGGDALREMGILSLQIQGGQIISMTVMSDEELKRKQASSSNSNSAPKIKLESDSSPNSSSLLVNLLQNKDQLEQNECQQPSQQSRPPTSHQNKRRKEHSGSTTGAINISNLESSDILNRSQNNKSASSASLMPPPTSLPPNLTSMVTSPVLAGASGTIPTLTSERSTGGRTLLINPNTGVLESGPSESSSEGETEHYDHSASIPTSAAATSSSSTRSSSGSSENKANLKLKLKLPVTPPQNTSSDSNSGTDSGGPKLPKLILSMRDKTVKQKFSNKAVDNAEHHNHSDNDSDNSENGDLVNSEQQQQQKLKKMKFIPNPKNSPKRTLNITAAAADKNDGQNVVKTASSAASSSKVTSSSMSSTSSSSTNSSSHNATSTPRVNHVISSNCSTNKTSTASASSSSSKTSTKDSTSNSSGSSSTSSGNGSGTKKQQQQPNSLVKDWTKSLSNHSDSNSTHTRLDKGAFDLRENNFEEMEDEDMEDLEEQPQRNKSFSGLKGTKKNVPPSVVQVNHVKLTHPNASNLKDVVKIPLQKLPPSALKSSSTSPPSSTTSLSVDSKYESNAFLNGPNGPQGGTPGSGVTLNSSKQRDLESSNLGLPPQEPMDSGAHQQGEDSGIESMDTLSEKSPNQGENPYPNEDRLERELASVSGLRKASPSSSLSSPSSTESTTTVQQTTNVITTTTTVASAATTLTGSGTTITTSGGGGSGNGTLSIQSSSTLSSTSGLTTAITGSVVVTSVIASPVSSSNSSDQQPQGGSGTATTTVSTNPGSNSEATPPNPSNNHSLSDKTSSSSSPTTIKLTTPTVLRMNGESNGSNGSSAKLSICKSIPVAASVASISEVVTVEKSLSEQTTELSKISHSNSTTVEQLRTASPVMVNGHTTNGGGGVTVRPAHIVPPSAKMVPVKLVSVSGEGNFRLVRVSPVKSSTPATVTTVGGGVAAVTATQNPPRTVIIKSTSTAAAALTNSVTGTTVITQATPPSNSLPLHLVSSQPLNATLLQNDNNTKETNSNLTTATAPGAGGSQQLQPQQQPPTLNLGPSLSILPVFDPPPACQSGTMSMKDVVESINKKNSIFEAAAEAAAAKTSTTTNVSNSPSVDQPLNIEVNRTSSVTVTSSTITKTLTRQPLVKRSPVQQSDFVSGGSLLKPLLATTAPAASSAATNSNQPPLSKEVEASNSTPPTPAVTATASTGSATATSQPLTSAAVTSSVTSNAILTNHIDDEVGKGGKRRRRDTDSSTKSDKSDISLISIESGHSVTSGSTTAPKKAKVSTESKKTTSLAKARANKNATSTVASKVKLDDDEPKVISNKKSNRVENARNKAKGKVNTTAPNPTPVINSIVTTASTPTTTTTSNVEPEVARRSGRQVPNTPTTPATRPPSARQATPTRQIVPSTVGGPTKATTTPSANNKKANNTQVAQRPEPQVTKPKRNSASPQGVPVSSGTSIAPTAVTNEKMASEKRMKTRSAKASTPSADENNDSKRRRLKLDS